MCSLYFLLCITKRNIRQTIFYVLRFFLFHSVVLDVYFVKFHHFFFLSMLVIVDVFHFAVPRFSGYFTILRLMLPLGASQIFRMRFFPYDHSTKNRQNKRKIVFNQIRVLCPMVQYHFRLHVSQSFFVVFVVVHRVYA